MKLLQQNHVKYGLWMTLVIVVCLLWVELMGKDLSDSKSYFQMLFIFIAQIAILLVGLRTKKKELGGKLTYKQGLTEGFKISLVYGVVSPFVFLLYYLLFSPASLEYARTAYQLTTASDATVIIVDMLVQFIVSVILGTLYGAIISLFVKTKS